MDIYTLFFQLFKKVNTRLIRSRFRRLDAYIDPRVEIKNSQFISIGKASIRPYTWIYAITGDAEKKNKFCPSIEIGNGCYIGRLCHITASNKVVLEDHVMLAEGILIADGYHGYEDTTIPIISQPYISQGPIIIGSGTWIGNGARIIGRVNIGRNCVIGANSVINKDVPDYCVVVGMPGRIKKRFNVETGEWLTVDEPLTRMDV